MHKPSFPQSIHPLSLASVRIQTISEVEAVIGVATGFVVRWRSRYWLITNWHVVAGRTKTEYLTDVYDAWEPGYPKRLRVDFHVRNEHMKRPGAVWHWPQDIALFDENNKPRWTELKGSTGRADLAALPFALPQGINPIGIGESMFAPENKLDIQPADAVSIVGFPSGKYIGDIYAAVWKTGHLASDLDLNYLPGWPSFLVDVTGRPGMSGAPVYAVRYFAPRSKVGKLVRALDLLLTARRVLGKQLTRRSDALTSTDFWLEFLGVYSGGILNSNANIELGIVWKRHLVRQLLEAAAQRA